MDKHTAADIDAFKAETGLEDSIVKELYSVFLEELQAQMQELLSELGRKDYDRIQKTIHNIKGISGSYMLPEVSEISKDLDAKLKQKNLENIGSGIKILTEAVTEARSEITRYLNS